MLITSLLHILGYFQLLPSIHHDESIGKKSHFSVNIHQLNPSSIANGCAQSFNRSVVQTSVTRTSGTILLTLLVPFYAVQHCYNKQTASCLLHYCCWCYCCHSLMSRMNRLLDEPSIQTKRQPLPQLFSRQTHSQGWSQHVQLYCRLSVVVCAALNGPQSCQTHGRTQISIPLDKRRKNAQNFLSGKLARLRQLH